MSSLDAETGMFTVTGRRTGGSTGAVGASYATGGGTATAGIDYTAATGAVTWAAGDTADKQFMVAVLDDLAIEGDETLSIALTSPQGGAQLATTSLALMIRDDDQPGDSVVLTSQRLATVRGGQIIRMATPSGVDGPLVGIDVRPATGQLWGLSRTGVLYTIDPATGTATEKATLDAAADDTSDEFMALDGTRFGVDFNPVVDRLRVVSDTGQNLRINVDTGATTTDGDLAGAVTGYAAAAYSNNFAAACRTQLFGIDPAGDRLILQNPPNDGTTVAVGGLGLDATAVVGFDAATTTAAATTASALLVVGGQLGVYPIDLARGTAGTRVALALAASETALDLAVAVPAGAVTQPPGELFGLSQSGRLLSFNRAAPAKPCTSVAIAGVASGETVVGIDFRPSTGLLYGLTSANGTGRLYTIDPVTGAATAGVTLNNPDRAVRLDGTAFGVDFNPTGPVALRIVSDTGQNLRVTNLDTGLTAVDTALNGAGTGATAAAYTNSVQGPNPGATRLFVLDTQADRLRRQNPPDAGTLVDVAELRIGSTRADLDASSAFDIDGRDNVGFVVANLAGATASTLHTIDLVTGALTSLGAIGGGERLRGITRPTPATTVFALAGDQLVRLSLADPSQVTQVGTVSNLVANEQLIGLDFRPSTGLLYGVGSLRNIYQIDPATAAGTRITTITPDTAQLLGTSFGVDFNPMGGVALRLVSSAENNLRLRDVLTGVADIDAPLSYASRPYTIRAVAYTNNVASPTSTVLYGLDSTSNRLVAITPPGAGIVREIGALGSSVGATSVFEIVAADTAIAVLQADTAKTLVTINLTTGAATPVGAVGVTGAIVGLAAPVSADAPPATSPVFVLDAAGTLHRFARGTPGTVTPIGSTMLPAGEVPLSIDVRPSTGDLWLLSRVTASGAGKLYTINTTTGAATLVTALAVAGGSDPFLLEANQPYEIDFNPTGAVALRITGPDGANLRIADPTNGATSTDTRFGLPAVPDVVSVAYTSSFAAPAGVMLTPTLYAIDAATASLFRIANPNGGVLEPVGALSPSAVFAGAAGALTVGGFDIAGGDDGVALAVLQRTANGTTSSVLFRINLTTGAATELGVIGGTAAVQGLAIQIR